MPKKDDRIWVAVRVLEGTRADGIAGEYCGRMSRRVFEQIRSHRDCEPLFKLDDPFWFEEGGSFVFLGHLSHHGYSNVCYFRADGVVRLIPLIPAFVKKVLVQMKNPPKSKSFNAKQTDRPRYSSIA